VITWINPDALRDYFSTDEAWEVYNRQYQVWRDSFEYLDKDLPIIREKTQVRKCRACGKFLDHNFYLVAEKYTWHVKEACLINLWENYLSKDKRFTWMKDRR